MHNINIDVINTMYVKKTGKWSSKVPSGLIPRPRLCSPLDSIKSGKRCCNRRRTALDDGWSEAGFIAALPLAEEVAVRGRAPTQWRKVPPVEERSGGSGLRSERVVSEITFIVLCINGCSFDSISSAFLGARSRPPLQLWEGAVLRWPIDK